MRVNANGTGSIYGVGVGGRPLALLDGDTAESFVAVADLDEVVGAEPDDDVRAPLLGLDYGPKAFEVPSLPRLTYSRRDSATPGPAAGTI